jgi:hypothetical protein
MICFLFYFFLFNIDLDFQVALFGTSTLFLQLSKYIYEDLHKYRLRISCILCINNVINTVMK